MVTMDLDLIILIQGGHRLYTYLSILFNAMIRHGYNPRELLLSSIISILKDMKSSSRDSNNYRGISLFNAICKVYDHVIIFLCYNKFITSDMQFGFKANHSTVMCSLVFHEIINHYLTTCSNVYSCLLDASKVFDKVHYGKLFRILLDTFFVLLDYY